MENFDQAQGRREMRLGLASGRQESGVIAESEGVGRGAAARALPLSGAALLGLFSSWTACGRNSAPVMTIDVLRRWQKLTMRRPMRTMMPIMTLMLLLMMMM